MKIGLDVGSTTIKCAVLDDLGRMIYSSYERHYSRIVEKTGEILRTLGQKLIGTGSAKIAVSGSAGMGMAESCGLPFVQEVYATRVSAKRYQPDADVIIELGGEDAKILFLTGAMEVRMNGSCAGGTGAFIDQMATLLGISLEEMNELAGGYEKIYKIASRCGVFAKSDIQPLLNQGARKNDMAASIFRAVVNQTIAGLAQGRECKGNILYLGGPLTFLSELRKSFDSVLGTAGTCPKNSLYYVAMGAAICATEEIDLDEALRRVESYEGKGNYMVNPPLFADEADYEAFCERHQKASVPRAELLDTEGPVYLGIDAGSTTVKCVVIDREGRLLFESYQPNSSNPVPLIKRFLEDLYARCPEIRIAAATVTGYGEELIKNAFDVDFGIVETVAHFTAAKHFMPAVDFVIDIGGQDIKCFKIHNGAVDNIFLNEACSSGCGSFLQTFANALGYSIADFAKLGILAKRPVNLGSRCTVFMNSSVKQAQKDGASVEDISAGLSISVVKNALYKVIRATSPKELGERIVVQGGTFLNDAVLRAFEQELGVNVVRPEIAGLMGAYGAALYAIEKSSGTSSIVGPLELGKFQHDVKIATCGLCNNRCQLTVNSFAGGRKFIGGNRCERPVTKKTGDNSLNIYEYKLELLEGYRPLPGPRGKIGIPMGLNFYELLPFWHTFFSSLGFEVVKSPISSRELYGKGQQTIPSDTVCFPAKLMHGHVQELIDGGVKTVFYPCMSYNIDEGLGDNHYNCPVVAYYPEVIGANMGSVANITFIKDYVGIHRKKDFPKKMHAILLKYFTGITEREVLAASKAAYGAYDGYLAKVRRRGEEMIAEARREGKHIIVLAGRPYHVCPEINHGIDKMIASFGVAVVSEDVVSAKTEKSRVGVLNQWTYHARLYAAANYIANQPDMDLVQLVSFGCGVDAITTDEVRELLESAGKIYTQIKIDEITNLGAVKIRIRSLFAAVNIQ